MCVLSNQCAITNEYSRWDAHPGGPELPKGLTSLYYGTDIRSDFKIEVR